MVASSFWTAISLFATCTHAKVIESHLEKQGGMQPLDSMVAPGSTAKLKPWVGPPVESSNSQYADPPIITNIIPDGGPSKGGMITTIRGTSFEKSPRLRCAFGQYEGGVQSVMKATYVSPSMVKCLSPMHAVERVSVEVTNNGVDYSTSEKTYTFWGDRPTTTNEIAVGPKSLQEMSHDGFWSEGGMEAPIPCYGPPPDPVIYSSSTCVEGIACKALVRGANFTTMAHPEQRVSFCKVYTANPSASPAITLGPSAAKCSLPPLPYGLWRLEVSLDGNFWSIQNKTLLSTYNCPQAYDMDPQTSPERGGQNVTVVGQDFISIPNHPSLPVPELKCAFGHNLNVSATVLNDTHLVCEVPAVELSGTVPFYIWKGDHRSPQTLRFEFFELAIISIIPNMGPAHGGTVVDIKGVDFSYFFNQKGYVKCRFGARDAKVWERSSVIAKYINNTNAQCKVPAYFNPEMVPDDVPVELVFGNGWMTDSNKKFTMLPPTMVTFITPSHGPETGSTALTIKGLNIQPTPWLQCGFGLPSNRTIVKALLIGEPLSGSLVCNTPAMEPGDRQVEVTLNGQDFSDSRKTFFFTGVIHVLHVTPKTLSTRGDEDVIIKATLLKDLGRVCCKFGTKVTNGTLVDHETVKCPSAPGQAGKVVEIYVSNDGKEWSKPGPTVRYAPGHSLTIKPTHGPVDGNFLVTMKVVDELYKNQTANETTIRVGGVMAEDVVEVDDDTVQFVAPQQPNKGVKKVEVLLDGVPLMDTQEFQYYLMPAPLTISDTVGSASGGDNITFTGGNFSTPLSFHFGTMVLPAIVANDSYAYVTTQPHFEEKVEVFATVPDELTGKPIESNTFFEYTFTTESKITKIDPPGCGELGGCVVTVEGAGFRNTEMLYCRFGDAEPVKAHFVSQNMIKCTSTSHPEMIIPLQITNDGKKFSNELLFEYHIKYTGTDIKFADRVLTPNTNMYPPRKSDADPMDTAAGGSTPLQMVY